MKILITGGHISPALAVIDKLLTIPQTVDIVFVGRKFPLGQERSLSLEFKEIQKRKIKFYDLQAGRLTRIVSFRSLVNFIKTPLGFWHAYQILVKERPSVVLAFGGYLALPIGLLASLMRIPLFIHEQTIQPGITNKFLSLLAKITFISFNESAKYFPSARTQLSGNPVRESIFMTTSPPFYIEKTRPVVYITGGSLGSHSLNVHVEKLLPQLLKRYIVIHQTGNVKEYNDLMRLSRLRRTLPTGLQSNYFIRDHFTDAEVGYVYSRSDIVVGRAGANTFFELLALKKPAIFVPLPWSSHKEQQKQASLFKRAGVGEIFDQYDDSQRLMTLINKVMREISYYHKSFKQLEYLYKQNATDVIIKTITSV
ncbi:UDP-N-acetylglucosamine--N-acetylmuramyl-(pentapeptide) pyrophosphoryl-undecaprenol N-acetylglucosamine transferase [Candidatus Roizmanbacteria bacterium]|nr:UDP-N-acetylglucosamine--N-acetylmuramyl-(pentapeptide) pyrophosphoryl-undecaprenol N-acetylglucosamine transferase [Candidatus Roizmanbacteria bacterium]